eukprot:2284078-Pyramimonas_sp.AAC.1
MCCFSSTCGSRPAEVSERSGAREPLQKRPGAQKTLHCAQALRSLCEALRLSEAFAKRPDVQKTLQNAQVLRRLSRAPRHS